MFGEAPQPKSGAAQNAEDRLCRWAVGHQQVVLGDCLAGLRVLIAEVS